MHNNWLLITLIDNTGVWCTYRWAGPSKLTQPILPEVRKCVRACLAMIMWTNSDFKSRIVRTFWLVHTTFQGFFRVHTWGMYYVNDCSHIDVQECVCVCLFRQENMWAFLSVYVFRLMPQTNGLRQTCRKWSHRSSKVNICSHFPFCNRALLHFLPLPSLCQGPSPWPLTPSADVNAHLSRCSPSIFAYGFTSQADPVVSTHPLLL